MNQLGYDWILWRAGNSNLTTSKARKDDDEKIRIFRELQNSPRVDREELNSYGLSNALLGQRPEVLRILQSMVGKCNDMADLRRRYLSKALHGWQGKETSQILKRVQIYQEELVGLHEDIRREGGYCPPTPVILTTTPALQ